MRARVVIGRVLLGGVALVLLLSGVDHFVSYGDLAEYYASLGWPPSVTEVIGVLQLIGAVLLVIPRVQRLAAVIVALAVAAILGREMVRGQEVLFLLEPAFWIFVACVAGVLLLFGRESSVQRPE
jgi:putative oxidoreductase